MIEDGLAAKTETHLDSLQFNTHQESVPLVSRVAIFDSDHLEFWQLPWERGNSPRARAETRNHKMFHLEVKPKNTLLYLLVFVTYLPDITLVYLMVEQIFEQDSIKNVLLWAHLAQVVEQRAFYAS